MKDNNVNLMELYFEEKDVAKRNLILKQLLCNMPDDAKDFFLKAFKKERYLDMKLSAVRGYAVFATEEEVEVLMSKLLELLKKVPEKAPYDYQEYESMRSVFLIPYLIKKYGYKCFDVFSEQLEKQYNDMPDCFKNIYTLDDKGNAYNIREPEEVKKSWVEFWGVKKL